MSFISKVKNLSQKAAEIKAAMQQLPTKVAQAREAVAATTGQFQQLKSEIQSSVADLKADNEDRLSAAMQEINASADVFLEAGFELGGMDLEISPVQRLLVHLNKFEDAHPSELRALVAANHHRKTTSAILNSMLQAQEISGTVELAQLNYSNLIVSIGLIPSVRLCWRAEELAPAMAQAAEPPPLPASSGFSQSSFFEARPPAMPAAPPPTAQPAVATPTAPAAKAVKSTPSGGHEDPLARFKKMPNLTKSRQ